MDSQTSRPSLLLSMPLEVLLLISSHLTTPDYGALRQTNKHLEVAFFNSFAREFFTKRQFMLTEFSLQALVGISKSRFANYLNYLIISVERPKLLTMDSTGHSASRPRLVVTPQDNEKFDKFREEGLSHQVLTSTGQDLELLVQALENLTNLVTIGMRDWGAKGRYRDGEHAKWSSYGATTLFQETGIDLQRSSLFFRNDDYPPYVFRTILRALGKTSNTRPERFEVILRKVSLSDSAFHFPQYLESTTTPIVANFKALFLDLNDWFPSPRNSGSNHLQVSNMGLKEFLCKARALEHLRLNFQEWNAPNDYVQLLRWLSMDPTCFKDPQASIDVTRLPPDPVRFENLSQIDIGFVNVEPRVLLQLYRSYKSTLRSISLHRVTLCRAKDEQKNTSQWNKFLSMIAVSGLTNLSAISITNPSQIIHGKSGRTSQLDIRFKDTPQSWEHSWSGQDLDQGLKDIEATIVFDKKVEDDLLSWNSDEEGSYAVNSS